MSSSSEIFDVFVGNVTSNTSEEQLRQTFEWIGPVRNVRIQMDRETGRTKGFAFVEFHDANAAIAAIRHLDGTELNGRRLRVSFSANSKLKELAKESGIHIHESTTTSRPLEIQAISNMQLQDVWDVLDAMKKMIDEDKTGQHVKSLLETYPQLITALLEAERRLGIVSSHSNTSDQMSSSLSASIVQPLPPQNIRQQQLQQQQIQQQQMQQQMMQQPPPPPQFGIPFNPSMPPPPGVGFLPPPMQQYDYTQQQQQQQYYR